MGRRLWAEIKDLLYGVAWSFVLGTTTVCSITAIAMAVQLVLQALGVSV